MKKLLFLLLFLSSCAPKDGLHTLQVLTTNDVHGRWFPRGYVDDTPRQSLMAVNYYVDSIRLADGASNVLLLDAGDCLQGDNASYYYNYVETGEEHLFSRLVAYMKYDAVTVGNHDIETGHKVYDRVRKELRKHGIPFLAGNAVKNSNGKPYFPVYKLFKRAGLKVLVLGYTNANNPAWMDESLWSGMHFENLLPLVQNDVDRLTRRKKPQVVIVCVHSATGRGDGKTLEAQGLDLYGSLHGVDLLVCSHDHSQVTFCNDTIALLNTGTRAKFLGHGSIGVDIKNGKPASKQLATELIPIDAAKTDKLMQEHFSKDFDAVYALSRQEIGALALDLKTVDAYSGMCPYTNLLHTVSLLGADAQIAFAAPLTYSGVIPAGILVYNDLFTIYPFENHLYKLRLTGREIKDYLEYSYAGWLAEPGSGHVLNVVHKDDPRNNQRGWSFVRRFHNFDSASGINYTVDIDKPSGERVCISSMADGSAFDPEAEYSVAMTSYRASGAGGMLTRGAGIPEAELSGRIVARLPEIREFIYDFVKEYGLIDESALYQPRRNGEWHFVPEDEAAGRIAKDLELLF